MFKRITLLLLVAAMLCSFAACAPAVNNGSEPTDAPSTPTTTPSTPAPTEPAAPTDPTDPTEPQLEEKTVAELLAMQQEENAITQEYFIVRATVSAVTNAA